jgi:hypothetical protein
MGREVGWGGLIELGGTVINIRNAHQVRDRASIDFYYSRHVGPTVNVLYF